MKKVGIVYDDIYLEHETGAYHPESPNRLKAIKQTLEAKGLWEKLIIYKPILASEEIISYIHSKDYIYHAKNTIEGGGRYLDSLDTPICPSSYMVARYSVGGGIKLADEIMANNIDFGFAAIRPPGHHATYQRAMGFCIFNNIAILSRYLQKHHHIKKILIIDWDVHHGNGTQEAFYEDNTVFYVSLHQFPHYPGTGKREEIGRGLGEGYTLNITMPSGATEDEYIKAFEDKILPIISEFIPEFILISAGFDAHKDDPLSEINLTAESYYHLTKLLRSKEEEYNYKIISLLEGGYNLKALGESVYNHIKALLE
jgi:acetoin utilization deacetylase AcuC-like enzyme